MTASTLEQTVKTVSPEAFTTLEEITLRIADRCDGCGAQAFVIARSPNNGSVLLFCGHHGAEYMPALAAQGFEVDDRRHLINAKPSPTSIDD